MKPELVDRTNHLYVYGSDIPAVKALQESNPRYAQKYTRITLSLWPR